jgi:hypothetical protein
MFKKMIIIAIATAAAVWVFAEPGTWGKETPAAQKEAKAPVIQFHRWLNNFRAAYEQRDGEKMEQLIKDVESKQKEMPAMPRIEKWLTKVKAAYQEQDAKKMGQLLDNADRMREQIRGRIGQNMMARRGRGDENFGAPGNRPELGRNRSYNRQRDNFRSGDNEGRPEEFRSRSGMPRGGEFEGPRAMRRFEPRRPMRFDEYGPEGFAPREPMGYGRMMPRRQDGNERPRDLAPMFNDGPGRQGRGPMNGRFAPRGPMRRRFAPQMRPGYGPRYDGPRNYPQDRPSQEYDRTVPRDFWY